MEKLTKEKQLDLVCQWIENGNMAQVARNNGLERTKVSKSVHRFVANHPEEFKKLQDAFIMRKKQEMIFKNTRTTLKALDKVEELLDDTTSLKDAAMSYGILYDKGALMNGEATSNSAIVIKMAGNIEELSK